MDNENTTLLVAIITGITALAASLASQVIAAHYSLKSKRMEVVYARKVAIYKELMKKVSVLAHETEPESHYRDFLLAFQNARLICSPKVDGLLAGDDGLMAHVWGMKMALVRSYTEYSTYKEDSFHKAMDRVVEAMRSDLTGLSR